MSRIGKKPISVPGGVKVNVAGRRVSVSGGQGTLEWDAPSPIDVEFDGGLNHVRVVRPNDQKRSLALHGTTRAILANMIKGVSEGFKKRLLIYGTGYGCKLEGNKLMLNVGFMGRAINNPAQFVIPIPPGIKVVVETPAARGENDPAKMVISGCDKQAVGQFAAEVRGIRPPEPYKGKGIRYEKEFVRRKQGKALASG